MVGWSDGRMVGWSDGWVVCESEIRNPQSEIEDRRHYSTGLECGKGEFGKREKILRRSEQGKSVRM